MGWYTDRVVPRLVDRALSGQPVQALRAQVVGPVSGTVLEVGFGSGLNLPFYGRAVTALDAVEPSDLAWERSAQRRACAPFPVRRTGLDGQDLAAADGSYEAAVCTFTLCTVPDPVRALTELRRVLVPGGVLRFLEHGRSPEPRVRRWQRRLDPVQRRISGGCHLTRDTVLLLVENGFAPTYVEHTYLAGGAAKPFTYLSWGQAARR